MTAATVFTYDDTSPHRPSLEELGGDGREDDPMFPPPKNGRFPYADEDNERARNQAGLNRVTPTCLIHVRLDVERLTAVPPIHIGDPVVTDVRAVRSSILTTDFTVVDNGPGDTSITWAPSLLPPHFTAVVSVASDVAVSPPRAFPIANGVRAKTELAGVGTDANFVLEIV